MPAASDVIGRRTRSKLFDAIAIQIDGLRVERAVVHQRRGDGFWFRITPLTTTKRASGAGPRGLSAEGLANAGTALTGDAGVLARLAAVFDPGDRSFAIVPPLGSTVVEMRHS
ncbi:MAG: hypothetical protein WBQ44_06400 [Rhodococcus sp. (in: high G+C Gram-positive bacteria)]